MRVLVLGAGVIGQVYAGRLAQGGHDVTMLARGERARLLAERGIRLDTGDGVQTCPVTVTTAPPTDTDHDLALVACRFDQLDSVIPLAARARTRRVVTLCNNPEGADRLSAHLGDRLVLGFPGGGGTIDDHGVVHFVDIRQQPTTIGAGRDEPVVGALRHAGFAVHLTDDMPARLATQGVFIVGVAAAILVAGGDSVALGRNRGATTRMTRAIGEGFTALRRHGVTPAPASLRTLFTIAPRVMTVPLWQRQLRGVMGTEILGPHARDTRDTELPALVAALRPMLGSGAPQLETLLEEAGL